MNKALLFRLHRWVTLVFALPLLVLTVTGLILSVEPVVTTSAIKPGGVDAERLTRILAEQDPEGRARGIVVKQYADEVTISGLGGGPRIVTLSTGAPLANTGALPALFGTSRSIHEHLILGLDWLVVPSTIAMLVAIVLGGLMGLPTLRNTVGGWHKATGWLLLPLLVASPLTGLMLAWNITFTAPLPATAGGSRVTIAEAVRVVAAAQDLNGLIWLRSRGPAMLARVVEDGEYRVYAVSKDGLRLQPRNWPRLVHEGAWSAIAAPAVNVVTSVALLGLLGTGVFLWTRRKLRRRQARIVATA